MRPTAPVAFALLCALLAGTLPAALADDMEANAERGNRDPEKDHRKQAWDRLTPDQKQKGMERAERHGLFSRFDFDAATGMATGRYVSFHIVAGTAAIHDVTAIDGARSTLFLEAVEPAGANGGSVETMGAILRDDASAVELTAHNNPTAGIVWVAQANVTLTFRLPADAVLDTQADPREVRFVVGTPHAHLLTTGAGFTRSGLNLTVQLQEGEKAAFRAHPSRGGETLHQENALFTTGRLGAQLRIADADGVAAEDGTELDVRATTREIQRGRVVVEVASDQHDARVVVLTVDSGTLDANGTFAATLNGTALARAEAAGLQPGQFAAVPSGTGMSTTFLVYVPSFSSYALAITSVSGSGGGEGTGTEPTSGAPAPGVALALAALALAGLALRRRA
jgi:hypothetical protein